MALRKAHGRAAELGALVVVESAPADELPTGSPAPPTAPIARRSDGAFTPAGARAAGRLGGKRSHERRKFAARLADQLGLADVGPEGRVYVLQAAEFARAQLAHLSATVGGGQVGPGPASVVHSAALALAASRYLYAQGASSGDPKVLASAARLADQSRTALLTAHELAARQAPRNEGSPLDLSAALAAADASPTQGGRR